MRILIPLAFAAVVASTALGDGISQLQLDNTTYTNISKVYIGAGNRVIILFPGGGTSATLDKVPKDFLESWGINQGKQTEVNKAVEEQAAKNLDRAIQMGCFRKVHGVVYDTRRQQSGWVFFQNAKVYQIVSEGALVDTTPNTYSSLPVLVRNLPSHIGDTDFINFSALPDGTFSYENKLGNERVVRAYDFGEVCTRGEIPETVLSGAKAFDTTAGGQAARGRDVLASLPEGEKIMASGSGFFITDDGYFITNAHVVKNALHIKIKAGGNVMMARLIRSDETADLALLKTDGAFAPLGISTNAVELGQSVFTIGFPDPVIQGTTPKYTDGKISSLTGIKDDPSEYQISVPVQPGNSGGPLADPAGNVEGVIVARLNDFAALVSSGSLPQNVNYAIKGSVLMHFLNAAPDLKLIAPATAGTPVEKVRQAVGLVLVY